MREVEAHGERTVEAGETLDGIERNVLRFELHREVGEGQVGQAGLPGARVQPASGGGIVFQRATGGGEVSRRELDDGLERTGAADIHQLPGIQHHLWRVQRRRAGVAPGLGGRPRAARPRRADVATAEIALGPLGTHRPPGNGRVGDGREEDTGGKGAGRRLQGRARLPRRAVRRFEGHGELFGVDEARRPHQLDGLHPGEPSQNEPERRAEARTLGVHQHDQPDAGSLGDGGEDGVDVELGELGSGHHHPKQPTTLGPKAGPPHRHLLGAAGGRGFEERGRFHPTA